MNFVQVQQEYSASVALESVVSSADKSFSGMVSSIANFFPSLRSSFVGAAEHLDTLKAVPSAVMSALSNPFSSVELSYEDFKNFSKVKIVTPESFSGNLYEYGQFLEQSWNFLQSRVIPEMDVFYAKLAAFASNKESKISLLDTSGTYKSIQDNYTSLVQQSKAYFGTTLHNKRSSELGVSFSDFDQYRKAEALAKELAKQLSPKQVTLIHSKVKKISDVLDIIIQDAQSKSYDKASYEAVKSLATGIYGLAELIEFYSVTYYRITEYAYAMSENKNVIKKLK